MSTLGNFVVKYLKDKIKTKYIIESDDFIELLTNMGIIDDEESLTLILDYLEEKNFEIDFKEKTSPIKLKIESLRRKYKSIKKLETNAPKIKSIMESPQPKRTTIDFDWLILEKMKEEEEINELNTNENGNI